MPNLAKLDHILKLTSHPKGYSRGRTAGYCLTTREGYPPSILRRKIHTPIAKQIIEHVIIKLHLVFLLHCVIVGFLPGCHSIRSRVESSVDIRRTNSGSSQDTGHYALRMQAGGNTSALEQLALHLTSWSAGVELNLDGRAHCHVGPELRRLQDESATHTPRNVCSRHECVCTAASITNAISSSNPGPDIVAQTMYVVVSGLAQYACIAMVFGGLDEYCGKLQKWISTNECSGKDSNEVNAA